MIPPTIGRVVLVYRGIRLHDGPQWHPATICQVNPDGTINVGGLDADGFTWCQQNIPLRQDDVAKDPVMLPPGIGPDEFACWMPYQRKQVEGK